LIWTPEHGPAQSVARAAIEPTAPPEFAVSTAARIDADLALAAAASAASSDAFIEILGAAVNAHERLETRVRRGDTLADLLAREGVAPREFNPALYAMNDVFDARTLQAGQHVEVFLDRTDPDAPVLEGVAFEPDVDQTIQIARTTDGGYRARSLATPLTHRVARAQGEITESLYVDAKAAGVDDLVIAEIASVLAYSVDFQREIRVGDQFDIVFDQYLNPAGEVVRTGDIHFVRFTPRGRELAFWRYTPPGEGEHPGYYDEAGESARRFLMRTPVNATRISSGFSRARRHPVLGYTRAHKGTDFAAPTGTPIYAAGNGVIERSNRYGSFGNYVRIRHANGYKTIYGHLNGFARGIRAGASVSQGQVIGYVGMTGTATGPHLHYEVHLNDVAINPMTIEMPTGRTLGEDELDGFLAERARIEAMRAAAVPADADADALTPMVADSETSETAAREVATAASNG
jgi:murein DD-endopeptidase MepM/ murein hydrolase activator NlpD